MSAATAAAPHKTRAPGDGAMRPSAAVMIADLIVRRVRLAALRRLVFLESVWEAATPPPGWAFTVDPAELIELERAFLAEAPEAQSLTAAIQAVQTQLDGPAGATRRRVADVFRLDACELDLLDVCAAITLDRSLRALFARLAPGAPTLRVTDDLAAALFHHLPRPIWRPASPLALWGFLAEQPDGLEIDPRVLDWLRGTIGLDGALLGCVRKAAPHEPLPSWPVEAAVTLAREARAGGLALRLVVRASAGTGRTTFAAAIAQALGVALLVVDVSAARALGQSFSEIFMRAQRLAHVGGFALAWRSAPAEPWPAHIGMVPLQFLIADLEETPPAHPDLADIVVELPQAEPAERLALWRKLLPASSAWEPQSLSRIAGAATIGVGDIAAVARGRPATPDVAQQRLRARIRGRLEGLGRLVETPFDWDDLVLTPNLVDALRDIAFEAAHRDDVLEDGEPRRLYGRRGVAAMFTGPPGTGKTMAAQVLARSLGRDLLVVDTAVTQSKFIGETAKNLKRIFAGVRGCPAILLFDEADAFFAKRTEVRDSNDRYANADTNYLLQLIEEFDGVVILATNQRTNIDAAFIRRLRHVVEFPRPDEGQRNDLWRRHLQALAGADAVERLAPLITTIAADVELSPAQIKGAAFSARLAAKRSGTGLDMAAFLKGIDRELAKEGRSLGRRERERILAA